MIRTKRIYEPRAPEDGVRMLIMRMWPRGIKKSHIDEWNRDVAPSRELVLAFKHEALPWDDYVRRYWAEVRPEALAALRARARTETITLLCACADEMRCHRGLLQAALAPARRPRRRE